MKSFRLTRPGVHPVWLYLERVRRRIPYAYWLGFDVVCLAALIWGNPIVRALCFAMLGVAVFFDVVEFFVKATEQRFSSRLLEGTGPPSEGK